VTSDRGRLFCLLLLPLLFQAPGHIGQKFSPASPTTQLPFILSSGYFTYFPVYAFVNSTVVHYSLISNTSVSTAFMTSAQFQDFNGSNGPVSNSITYQNGTESTRALRVSTGSYDVLVYAFGKTANATLDLSILPNNPFGFGPLPQPEPSGIASYGLTNQSGVDTPYAVASTDVAGVASIASISAYNSTAESAGQNPSGATLQLNSVLVIRERGGGNQVYWCQNTPDFVTAASQVALGDNVWNYSASGFLSNDSVTSEGGGGSVSTFQQNGQTQYFYAFGETNSTYSLPLGVVLLMNATTEPGTGVLVQFGARMTGITMGQRPGTYWFDNVTIHDPAAEDAYFFTAGNYTTPLETFYDTELVFGGEGGGEATSFTQLSAALGLYYANGTSSRVEAFPSYFSFGGDTAESADNVRVTYLGSGDAKLSVGTPNYDYLGAASGSYALSVIESSLANSTSATTSSSTGTETTSTGSAMTGTSSTSGIPAFPLQPLAVSIFVSLMLLSYLVVRRMKGRNEMRQLGQA